MTYLANTTRYEQMTRRTCGKSGLKLPAIFGSFWDYFGGVGVYESYRSILTTAFDHGVTHFDLANNYGPPPGSAGENFGLIMKIDQPKDLQIK